VEAHLQALGAGTLHLFATWKQHAGVPHVAAGVYTIWRRLDGGEATPGPGQLLYVGHAGRDLTAEQITAKRSSGARRKALWSRLHAHACGRRSGDQLAIYVADRFVLPAMSTDHIAAVAAGTLEIDALVRRYVIDHLAFRWVETLDGSKARALEAVVRRGQWDHGKPLLNPL
jgi:hypothetical protein